MREFSEQDTLRKLIDSLTERMEEELINFESLREELDERIKDVGWKDLPEISENMPTVAAVDGGSRQFNTRGTSIIFTQAAGRVMGRDLEGAEWLITRRALISESALASDLAQLLRQRLELSISTALMREHRPEFLLFDGVLNGIYRVGVPARIHKGLEKGTTDVPRVIQDYMRELIIYGEQLTEFLAVIEESGTKVIGLPKDSYTSRYLQDLDGISDTTFFSLVAEGSPGYSKEITFDAMENLENSVLIKLWEDNGIELQKSFRDVTIFYVNLRQNGTPIRIDQFSHSFLTQEELLPKLLTLSDGKDWFIPPRLAHERAVVRDDVFDSFYRGLYNSVEKISPRFAKYVLGESRRRRTQ